MKSRRKAINGSNLGSRVLKSLLNIHNSLSITATYADGDPSFSLAPVSQKCDKRGVCSPLVLLGERFESSYEKLLSFGTVGHHKHKIQRYNAEEDKTNEVWFIGSLVCSCILW